MTNDAVHSRPLVLTQERQPRRNFDKRPRRGGRTNKRRVPVLLIGIDGQELWDQVFLYCARRPVRHRSGALVLLLAEIMSDPLYSPSYLPCDERPQSPQAPSHAS